MLPLLIWIVSRAIALNYKTSFMTIEIRDVVPELMLSSELEPEQASISD